jgi:two-component system, OmpR family, phosphate regulon sensor histidine kinase PhoR
MGSSLFGKLGLALLALLLAVLLGVDFYTGRTLRRAASANAEERLNALAQLAVERPPRGNDRATLAGWISWMARGGARVTAIAPDGRVVGDSAENFRTMGNQSGRPEFRQAMVSGEGESTGTDPALGARTIYRAFRIRSASGGSMILRFALPAASLDSALAAIQISLLGALLILLLAGAALTIAYSHRFSHRVKRMKEFSRRMGSGDFRPLPPERDRDELAGLAEALNTTAANLVARIGSLSEQSDLSAAILRDMVEGVAVIDSGERLAYCNYAFAEIVGRQATQAEGRPILEVIREPQILELVRRALSGEEDLRGEIQVGGNRRRVFAVTVSPVSPPGAESRATPFARKMGAVVVFYEITELRRLEQVRKDFVANVSHELKTPLTSIQGFAETLLAGALTDRANSRRFVEIIRAHALRLSRLTDDLLKLSRIEAGKLDLEFQPVSLARLIEASVETTRPRAEAGHLSLSIDCPADLPPVPADPNLLREVLQNLLDNAVQYTPAEGRIEVSARVAGDSATVTVADTGIGVPEAEQQRIFERFYRIDPARSRELGSTGLGLAISKHIVEAHGGEIGVESAVGRGSKFTFRIPLARESAAARR